MSTLLGAIIVPNVEKNELHTMRIFKLLKGARRINFGSVRIFVEDFYS
jgi:hypothetical protein